MTVHRPSLPALMVMAGLMFQACSRHRLDEEEIERNRIYAAILEREDLRSVGSDDFFESTLESSPYVEARVWCAIALGRIGDPRALPMLFRALGSEYAAVRSAAAFAIGEIEDRDQLKTEGRQPVPEAAAQLIRRLDDSSLEVRMRAAEALGKSGSAADAVQIASRLDRLDYGHGPEMRAYIGLAITGLMRLRNREAAPTLHRLAGIDDAEIQWRAVSALARLRDKSAESMFLRLLDSPSADVRAWAARGIGACQNRERAANLLPLLASLDEKSGRPNPLPVRVSALQALSQLQDPGSTRPICAAIELGAKAVESPDHINFTIQAIMALGAIGNPEAEPTLVRLSQRSGPVADSAVIALAKVLKSTPARFFELVKPSEGDDPAAARAWAQALGELMGPEAIRELKRLLVRAADDHARPSDILAVPTVLSALAGAGAPDLRDLLSPYLGSHDMVILRAAIAAYPLSDNRGAPWSPFVQAFRSVGAGGDIETKVSILNRFEPWLKESEVQDALHTALRDRLRDVRIAAARLLRQAGASAVPDDPGPSETRVTRESYNLIAGARKDHTIALIETTKGHVEIELFREDAPLTAANFVSLARRGFYDGLSFMRVVPYFVVQGGDPRNDQEGGPGYAIRCEINLRPFERGSVGMALAGKDTGGSQFFITLAPQPHLDGGYTCFGRVISGMQAIDRLVPGDRILKVEIDDEVAAFDYRHF